MVVVHSPHPKRIQTLYQYHIAKNLRWRIDYIKVRALFILPLDWHFHDWCVGSNWQKKKFKVESPPLQMLSGENLFSCLPRPNLKTALSVSRCRSQQQIAKFMHNIVQDLSRACSLDLSLVYVARTDDTWIITRIGFSYGFCFVPNALNLVVVSCTVCIEHQHVFASRV